MQKSQVILVMAWAMALATTACFYDPDLSKISEKNVEGEDSATTDTDTDTENRDAGNSDSTFSGIGRACEADADDCAGYDADFCVVNPLNPDEPGYCTVTECDTRGCPEAYNCCDCSGVGMEIMCVPDDQVSLVSAYCECG